MTLAMPWQDLKPAALATVRTGDGVTEDGSAKRPGLRVGRSGAIARCVYVPSKCIHSAIHSFAHPGQSIVTDRPDQGSSGA
ncbi:MAG: hypothetical protein AAGF32_01175 [Pseudomonadota bacterium]